MWLLWVSEQTSISLGGVSLEYSPNKIFVCSKSFWDPNPHTLASASGLVWRTAGSRITSCTVRSHWIFTDSPVLYAGCKRRKFCFCFVNKVQCEKDVFYCDLNCFCFWTCIGAQHSNLFKLWKTIKKKKSYKIFRSKFRSWFRTVSAPSKPTMYELVNKLRTTIHMRDFRLHLRPIL